MEEPTDVFSQYALMSQGYFTLKNNHKMDRKAKWRLLHRMDEGFNKSLLKTAQTGQLDYDLAGNTVVENAVSFYESLKNWEFSEGCNHDAALVLACQRRLDEIQIAKDHVKSIRERRFHKIAGINWTLDGTDLVKTGIDDGGHWVEGIASSTAVDRENDRFDEAVMHKFADQINSSAASGRPILLFSDHDHNVDSTLGKITSGKVTTDGDISRLYIHADLESPRINQKVQSLLSKLNSGTGLSFSIGGDCHGYAFEYDRDSGKRIRRLKDATLLEISAVGIPALEEAAITAWKSCTTCNPRKIMVN
jgi:HK97 family phage prohead protease